MTTLMDVAERAGVSKSTVSNVIRGTALVAEETRARVERAIAETGYHPNAIARSLKARTSSAIGIVVPDLTNPFYAQLAVGVERAAGALGYAVLTANTECLPSTEEDAARAWLERRVDGVIIGGMSLASNLPRVLLNRMCRWCWHRWANPMILGSVSSTMTMPAPWKRSSSISTASAIADLPSSPITCASMPASGAISASRRR